MKKSDVKEVIQNKNFLLVVAADVISSIGDWIYFVAIAALIYNVTHSGAGVAKLKSAQTIALLIATPVIGVIIDRLNRKNLLLFTDAGRALILLLLIIFKSNIAIVYLGAVCITIMGSISGSADNAMMPDIVKKEQLVTANSISYTASQIVMICGGALGGLVIAIGHDTGYNLAFIIDFFTFVVSFILISLVRGQFKVQREDKLIEGKSFKKDVKNVFKGLFSDIVDCLKYIKKEKYISVIILMFVLLSFGAGAVNVLTIVFANKVLLVGSKGYGFLLTVQGVGSFLASALIVFLNRRFKPIQLFNIGFLMMGLSMTILGMTRSFWFAGIMFFISGFGNILFIVPSVSVMQQIIPSEVRGRVFSLQNVAAELALLVGMLVTSLVEGMFDTGFIISVGGMFETAGALFSIIFFMLIANRKLIQEEPSI